VANTLTLHWNGASWVYVASPNAGNGQNQFTAVAAAAGDDVWAVGYDWNISHQQTLTAHWNGAGWSVANSANNPPGKNARHGPLDAGNGIVWAVGDYYYGATLDTLAENYSLYCTTPTPSPTPVTPVPTAVPSATPCALSFNDVHSTDYFYAPVEYLAC